MSNYRDVFDWKVGLSGDVDALRPRAYLFARHSDGATLHVTSRCEIRSGWLTSVLTVYVEPPDDEFEDSLGAAVHARLLAEDTE